MNRDVAVLVGSLRKEAFSRKLAHALASLAPPSLKLSIIEIGHLPLYNQDLEADPPAAWTTFRQRVSAAAGVRKFLQGFAQAFAVWVETNAGQGT